MNKLEKTLGAIFVAGLVTFGIGVYKESRIIKNIGKTAIGLSLVTFAGHEYKEYERAAKARKIIERHLLFHTDLKYELNDPKGLKYNNHETKGGGIIET